MKSVSCKWAAVLLLVVFGMSALPAAAESTMIMKLGRGIANVVFGPLELPIQVQETKLKHGGIAGLTYGTLRGVAFVVARLCVGVVDIVTFPFPLPNCPETPDGFGAGYGPIMYPAWVIDVEHDWWNFVYDRDSIPTPIF